jgi:hypothetical protein
MKNIFLAFLAPISMSIAMSEAAFAQTSDNTALLSFSYAKKIPSMEELYSSADSGFHYFNEISLRAVRGFMEEFKDVYNVNWFKCDKGFVASFVKDSVDTRVHYDKWGYNEVQFRYYLENRLSPEIKTLVRSKYYDYHIFHITEVRKDGVTSYQVKIREKNHCKVINVLNGVMKVAVEYSDVSQK